jgi:tetratricopeptide (TPR) repeat protein
MSLASVLYNAKRYQEAIPLLKSYVAWRPDMSSARQYLAAAYRETGQVDSADAVLRAGGATVGSSGGPDTTSANYFINRGAARYQANEHAKAAEDFEAALVREPMNRTALRNLAATYYTLHNAGKLGDVAGKIVELEPYSESARRFQIQALIWSNTDRPRLERLSDELDALPVKLEDMKLTVSGGNATLAGTATGRPGKTAAGAAIPATAVPMVVEFTDAGGTVISSVDLTVPALQAGVPSPVNVAGTGAGIVSWRYKKK